jgi:hypothetical protein
MLSVYTSPSVHVEKIETEKEDHFTFGECRKNGDEEGRSTSTRRKLVAASLHRAVRPPMQGS